MTAAKLFSFENISFFIPVLIHFGSKRFSSYSIFCFYLVLLKAIIFVFVLIPENNTAVDSVGLYYTGTGSHIVSTVGVYWILAFLAWMPYTLFVLARRPS